MNRTQSEYERIQREVDAFESPAPGTARAGNARADSVNEMEQQRSEDEQAEARRKGSFRRTDRAWTRIQQERAEQRAGAGYREPDGTWVSARRPGQPEPPDPPSPIPPSNPPSSLVLEQGAQFRYVVWLVVGIALFGPGVGALYSMYSAPSAGFVPLVVALCLAVSGAYIGLAAVFNLWLPRPRVQPIRHHIRVSAAVLLGLVFVAWFVAWSFPRKQNGPNSTVSSAASTSLAPYATVRGAKTTNAIATPNRPRHTPSTVRGHTILDISPDKLESLCEGYTSLQCGRLRKPYEDKWVQWTGTVRDIDDIPGVSLRVPSRSSYLGYTSVGVMFKKSERDEVVHLRVGDKITIIGRLAYGVGGILEDAELIRNITTDEPLR